MQPPEPDSAPTLESKNIKSTHTLFLEKPPCCLEFFTGSAEGWFVVGTYDLVSVGENKAQEREGSLVVCVLEEEGNLIKVIEEIPVPFGVLDVHFSPRAPNLLAAATSTGSLAFYLFVNDNNTPATFHLEHLDTLQLFDASIIVTSLAWKPDVAETEEICVTLTSGEVVIVKLPPLDDSRATKLVTKQEVLHTHSLEAWTTVYTSPAWSPQGIISGGDDATIAFIPLLNIPGDAEDEDEPVAQVSVNHRIHNAGITAILPLPFPVLPQDVFLTGSYDDHLRILSLPSVSFPQLRPQVLHEVNLGGGVWRLKVLSTKQSKGDMVVAELVVSCMYAGAFIVKIKFENEKWSTEIIAQFEEHESMCYACDVLPAGTTIREDDRKATDISAANMEVGDELEQAQKNEAGVISLQKTIVSSSFYDKRLCLWKW